MRKNGRVVVPLTDKEREAVIEYLEGDLGMREVGEKYGTTKSGIAYWLKKYRKEQEAYATKEDNG